jgi:hypothetical protein
LALFSIVTALQQQCFNDFYLGEAKKMIFHLFARNNNKKAIFLATASESAQPIKTPYLRGCQIVYFYTKNAIWGIF